MIGGILVWFCWTQKERVWIFEKKRFQVEMLKDHLSSTHQVQSKHYFKDCHTMNVKHAE